MLGDEVFVDPSCPWAWITSRWLKEAASQRDLTLTWRSYCLEIRDAYGVAPTVPVQLRDTVVAAHAISHRLLRIFESLRASANQAAIDPLYTEWGRRFFVDGPMADESLVSQCLDACGLNADLIASADDARWDVPIMEAMEVAYAFGGPKTQTPVVVVGTEPPHGFKGPVMATAPTGEAAARLWDAVEVLTQEPGFFEIARPRTSPPRPAQLV